MTFKTFARSKMRLGFAALMVVLLGASCIAFGLQQTEAQASEPQTAQSTGYLPGAKHVFVINLENKGYDTTWGTGSAAPYLSTTLRNQGVLLNAASIEDTFGLPYLGYAGTPG